jgi:signal transduction histidine kinase
MKTKQSEPDAQGRVLIVDDDPKNRLLLGDLLSVNGYAVIEAGDGAAAIEKAESEACDVILLDVMMPVMDGLEACRKLKANPKTAHIPVLMVSALVDRDQRRMGVEAGANDYLTKPIDRQDVTLRVRNALAAKRLYDRVQQDLVRLRELEAAQDSLTHMIVHDMRSPLTVVAWSYDFLLREKSLLSPQQQEYIGMGQKCCAELVEMVSSMLDISRMETGKMPLNPRVCSLIELARKAAEAVAVLAGAKRLTLEVGGDSVNVNVDSEIMHRVFVNLLGNAIKFSPESGLIRIDISDAGGTVRAMVTDQGVGIPAEFHHKIFEKFGQVEPAGVGMKRSWGLGLTFCKLALEAHSGCIGVESPAMKFPALPGVSSEAGRAADSNKGSTFWFSIPKA